MRGFNEQEKEHITQVLCEKGKEFFSVHGFKKTSIKDLTEAAGIAQGSFYLFFESKEFLYFKILEKEEEHIKNQLLPSLTLPMNASNFASFLLKGLELVSYNPLIRRLYFEGELEQIVRKLPKEIVETHIKKDNDILSPLLKNWGIGSDKSVGGVIRAFFLLALHKKEIGEEDYDNTIQFLAEAISNKLFGEGQ